MAVAAGVVWGTLERQKPEKPREFGHPLFDPAPFEAVSLVRCGVMAVGIAGILLFPRTHIGIRDGATASARDMNPRRTRCTGNGFRF